MLEKHFQARLVKLPLYFVEVVLKFMRNNDFYLSKFFNIFYRGLFLNIFFIVHRGMLYPLFFYVIGQTVNPFAGIT